MTAGDARGPEWDAVYEGIEALVVRWDAALERTGDEEAAHREVRDFLVDHVLEQSGGGPHSDHAHFMYLFAEHLAESGRTADALTTLTWLAEVYAGQADPGMAVPAIMALTDLAVWLSSQDSGPTRAMEVMRLAVNQVAPGAHVAIQGAACRALTQVALLTASLPAPDFAAFRRTMVPWHEIIDRWSGSEDPELRSRLAQAQNNLAYVHLQLGEEEPARMRFARAAALSRGPGDTAVQEFIAMGASAGRVLSALDLPESAALRTDLVMVRGDPAEQTEQLLRMARARHTLSVGKVKAWSCGGQPFVLLLRNFDLLEWTYAHPGPDGVVRSENVAYSFNLSRRGHTWLQQLGRQVPVAQVASTESSELELNLWQFNGAPIAEAQLYLADDTWFDTVTQLISLAETVIIWAEGMTPPLEQELAAVRARGRTEDTIVLIEEADDDPSGRAGISVLVAENTPVSQIKPFREQLTPDSPALVGFPHVVDVRGIPKGDDIGVHPALQALERRYGDVMALPPEARVARLLERIEGGR